MRCSYFGESGLLENFSFLQFASEYNQQHPTYGLGEVSILRRITQYRWQKLRSLASPLVSSGTQQGAPAAQCRRRLACAASSSG